jgi:hypothetical protein
MPLKNFHYRLSLHAAFFDKRISDRVWSSFIDCEAFDDQ